MAAFIEGFDFFARWLSILAIGAPVAAVASCLGAYHFARHRGASFEFTDALLFSAAGGLFGPTLASAVALAIGALGPDVATFPRAASLLLNTALFGLLFGLALGVPLGFVAVWVSLRHGTTPSHLRDRRQH